MPQPPQAWEEESARFNSTLADRNKQTNKTTNHPQHSVPRYLPPQQRAPLWYHQVSDLGKGQPLLTEKLKVRLRLGTLTDWEICARVFPSWFTRSY